MQYVYRLLTGEWVDTVTRLPNEEFSKHLINELKKSGDFFYILHIKLNFDTTNENVRNFALSRVSSVIKHSVRIPKDFVCKIGGNDFCVVAHGITEVEAEKIANRIKESLHYLLLTYGSEKIQIGCEIDIQSLGGEH
ncbi:MAG: diguanylate cyclase domain-containing protein [Fervidobacterium sp.]